jgi:hypothetical protein
MISWWVRWWRQRRAKATIDLYLTREKWQQTYFHTIRCRRDDDRERERERERELDSVRKADEMPLESHSSIRQHWLNDRRTKRTLLGNWSIDKQISVTIQDSADLEWDWTCIFRYSTLSTFKVIRLAWFSFFFLMNFSTAQRHRFQWKLSRKLFMPTMWTAQEKIWHDHPHHHYHRQY